MESFKIIDISGNSSKKPKKKLSKKQIYKEILSSSDKVKEIINNRKKTKRFDYLNMLPKISNEPEKENKQESSQETTTKKTELISSNSKSEQTTEAQINPKAESNQMQSTPEIAPIKKIRKPRVKRNKTPKNNMKDSKINDYFKPDIKQTSIENKIVEKAQQTVVEHLQSKIKRQPSPKENKSRFKPIKPVKPNKEKEANYTNVQLKSQPKQFTQNQIKDILKIFIKLNSLNQYYKIHKTIRRLNKIKVNQLLFALRLIKKFSNAPDNMLKNTLFNYITSDIRVQLQ